MRLLVGVAAVLLSVACSDGRSQARLVDYRLESPDTLRVSVPDCRVNATVEDLQETATEVRILVLQDQPSAFGRSLCADTVLVELAQPLGTRSVINARNGVAVPVLGG